MAETTTTVEPTTLATTTNNDNVSTEADSSQLPPPPNEQKDQSNVANAAPVTEAPAIVDDEGFTKACHVAEIPNGRRRAGKRVVIKGQPIAVFKGNDKIYALDSRCSHAGSDLSRMLSLICHISHLPHILFSLRFTR